MGRGVLFPKRELRGQRGVDQRPHAAAAPGLGSSVALARAAGDVPGSGGFPSRREVSNFGGFFLGMAAFRVL